MSKRLGGPTARGLGALPTGLGSSVPGHPPARPGSDVRVQWGGGGRAGRGLWGRRLGCRRRGARADALRLHVGHQLVRDLRQHVAGQAGHAQHVVARAVHIVPEGHELAGGKAGSGAPPWTPRQISRAGAMSHPLQNPAHFTQSPLVKSPGDCQGHCSFIHSETTHVLYSMPGSRTFLSLQLGAPLRALGRCWQRLACPLWGPSLLPTLQQSPVSRSSLLLSLGLLSAVRSLWSPPCSAPRGSLPPQGLCSCRPPSQVPLTLVPALSLLCTPAPICKPMGRENVHFGVLHFGVLHCLCSGDMVRRGLKGTRACRGCLPQPGRMGIP